MLRVFDNLQLGDTMGEDFRAQISDEIFKDIFTQTKRTQLCVYESESKSPAKREKGNQLFPSLPLKYVE